MAIWTYSVADQRERRLEQQFGTSAGARSPRSWAARSVARAAIAVLRGIVLTPLVLLPIGVLMFVVSALGVPIEAIPDEVRVVLGAVAIVVVSACSYRWLRHNPSSPLGSGDPTDP